jgi:hypothetical protein
VHDESNTACFEVLGRYPQPHPDPDVESLRRGEVPAWLLKRLAEHPEHFLATARYGGLPDDPGRVMAAVETAILGGLTYTNLRDAILAHPPMAEGLNAVFAAIPTASR